MIALRQAGSVLEAADANPESAVGLSGKKYLQELLSRRESSHRRGIGKADHGRSSEHEKVSLQGIRQLR
jgi:hypothetical protein